jgi:NADH dehydrogenase [ubiquinone] 1 alpha subcomplex assembly factor 1
MLVSKSPVVAYAHGDTDRIVFKLEGIRSPTRPFPLILFNSEDDITRCKRMSDKDIGGFSAVNLDFHPVTHSTPSHARFHGNISTKLPADQPHVMRTGYAGWRTLDRGFTIFGKSLWDLDPYRYLAIQFKSDGRKYFVNIQTESIVATDIHQHRLHSRTPGEWETLLIQWDDFVRTNHGEIVEPQHEMLTQKVRSVGMALIDRIPGPYDLSISKVWATNARSDDEHLANFKGAISGLPSDSGEFSKVADIPKRKQKLPVY